MAVGQPVWRQPVPLAAAAAFVAAFVTGFIGWTLWPTVEPPQVMRFSHDVQQRLNLSRPVIALAPDGRNFVYATTRGRGLHLRTMDGLEARPIPGTEEDLTTPFFSPDGLSVGYFQNGQLKRIAISGGAPRVIAPATRSFGQELAAEMYRELLEENPADTAAHYGLGRVLALKGDSASAIASLGKALDLSPNYGVAHYELALAYRDAGDERSSEAHMRLYEQYGQGAPSTDFRALAPSVKSSFACCTFPPWHAAQRSTNNGLIVSPSGSRLSVQ